MNSRKFVFSRLVVPLSLVLLIFLNVIASANATSIRQLDMNDMLETAELVFEGRVLKSEARRTRNSSTIKTFILFEVDEVISGDYSKDTLLLSFEGGTVDGETVEIQGLRTPEVGEKGIYFIESLSRSLVNPIVGWSQGHFLLKSDDVGNDTVMTEGGMHVVDIDEESSDLAQSKTEISAGVVNGIKVNRSATQLGMTSERFKQVLKRRMQKKQSLINQE